MTGNQTREASAEAARFKLLGLKPGRFEVGSWVRLRSPEESQGSFDEPAGPLQVVGANWFRTHDGPTYTLAEEGCSLGVTPFRDEDLDPCEAPSHVFAREAIA